MQMFDMLTDISPWYWVAFALLLGAVEMATMSFFLIWPALAALLIALLLVLFPSMSAIAQVVLFAIFSIALTFAGRAVIAKYGDGSEPNDLLNNRSNQMVGRVGTVLEFRNGTGAIDLNGTRWRAHWEEGTQSVPASSVVITKANGMDVWVKPI